MRWTSRPSRRGRSDGGRAQGPGRRTQPNRAKDIIEDFMIAANGVTARYLASRSLPSSAARCPHAPTLGPDRRARRASEANVARRSPTPRLSSNSCSGESGGSAPICRSFSSVIKLLGAGEYVVEVPGGNSRALRSGGQGLFPFHRPEPPLSGSDHAAVLKAATGGRFEPYSNGELEALATHCTEAEDAAKKVERQVRKSAAAMLLEPRIGEQFDAIVTGASDKGTWVRLFHPCR